MPIKSCHVSTTASIRCVPAASKPPPALFGHPTRLPSVMHAPIAADDELLEATKVGSEDRVLIIGSSSVDLLCASVRRGCRSAMGVAVSPRHPEPVEVVLAPPGCLDPRSCDDRASRIPRLGQKCEVRPSSVGNTRKHDRRHGCAPRARSSQRRLRRHTSARTDSGRTVGDVLLGTTQDDALTGEPRGRAPMHQALSGLHGSIPALVTPFRSADGELDEAALARLAKRAVAHGTARRA